MRKKKQRLEVVRGGALQFSVSFHDSQRIQPRLTKRRGIPAEDSEIIRRLRARVRISTGIPRDSEII
jgi:hypothetical protein